MLSLLRPPSQYGSHRNSGPAIKGMFLSWHGQQILLSVRCIILNKKKINSSPVFLINMKHDHNCWMQCNEGIYINLTRPTKKRTATAPDRTAAYCIHVLRTAILRLKLFAVEKTPIKRSSVLFGERGADLSNSRSIACSESSDVGRPLATTEIRFRSPEILTSLTSHGSKV